MSKTSRLEYLNLNENKPGFEIAVFLSTVNKRKYEVSVIIEDESKTPVIWVDVFKNWIEDNDRAFHAEYTQMFHTIRKACNYIEKEFGLHPKTKTKLLKYRRKEICQKQS